jgi:hypothetical protein
MSKKQKHDKIAKNLRAVSAAVEELVELLHDEKALIGYVRHMQARTAVLIDALNVAPEPEPVEYDGPDM